MDISGIIALSGLGLIIVLGIGYSIWYSLQKRKNSNFENVQTDFFVYKLANKFKSDLSIKFLLNEQINYEIIRELNDNYRAMMITERMVYLFKYMLKKPDEQSLESLVKEEKLISKLVTKTNLKNNNFCILKFYSDKIYSTELNKYAKKSSEVLLLINEIMWEKNPLKINQNKLEIFRK